MSLSRATLARIARLRELFLAADRGDRALGDYWRDRDDLAAYDEVLAARIGFKWDAVLDECSARGLPLAHGTVLDYGCGSGIASRRFVTRFAARAVRCHDRSAAAMQFAVERLRAAAPNLDVATAADPAATPVDTLLVSHVLGELDARGEAALRAQLDRCRYAILVEPGSHDVARRLAALRDELRERFAILAPCTHARACPTLARPRDWCHMFAAPPPEVFTDGDWVKTARAVGFDLRSLPYSFLALARQDLVDRVLPPAADGRVLGRPAPQARGLRIEVCSAAGLHEVHVDKRRDPDAYRALDKRPQSVRFWPPAPRASAP